MNLPRWLPLASAIALGVAIIGARRRSFPAALLDRALDDEGITEKGGKNRGPEVENYLRNVGASPGDPWCAAAAWTWIRDAAKASGSPRVLEVIPATASAKGLSVGPKKAGWWVEASKVRATKTADPSRPPPGSLAIWDRSEPIGTGWQGHVGVLERWQGDTWVSLEGNSGPQGDRVAVMNRVLSDPRLLGFVVFPEAP